MDHIIVRPAVEGDISSVISIEGQLREDRPTAEDEGFLLSGGDTPESYAEFVSYRSFYVAVAKEDVVGFAFALPPGSTRLARLKAIKEKFRLEKEKDVFDRPEVAWMAKIGVAPAFMRQGIGGRLYLSVLTPHPEWHTVTTTVFSPLRNLPSEQFHEKLGFEPIGNLPLGNRGTLSNVSCRVHYRSPRSA